MTFNFAHSIFTHMFQQAYLINIIVLFFKKTTKNLFVYTVLNINDITWKLVARNWVTDAMVDKLLGIKKRDVQVTVMWMST